jgi:hypothetical protein
MLKNSILRPHIWPLLLFFIANSLILISAPPGLRYVAALLLLAFLPGWVWLQAFLAAPPNPELSCPALDIVERLTLAVGLSLALTAIGAMLAAYLPGTLDLLQILLVMNVIIWPGLAISWRRQRQVPLPSVFSFNLRAIILLLLLVMLTAALRLPNLGYAEFHEDEAEVLMLGVRLLQGEDYALFLHRKGPVQMLIPVAFWLLTGQITETMARFPFVLSSIFSVVTLFVIGRRWFGLTAGFCTALLWAINGYSIVFGRIVQFPALILFLGPLGLYYLWLAGGEVGKNGRMAGWRAGGWLMGGALLLAVCLLAHYDGLLLLPAAAYLGWVVIQRGSEQTKGPAPSLPLLPRPPASLLFAIAIALALFLGLLAAFYIPYVRDPEFQNTVTYLGKERVKPGLLYNNLGLLQRLDQTYSSRFYLPLLLIGLIGGLVWSLLNKRPSWLATLTTVEGRTAWLTFGASFIGYIFLIEDPRAHLYIIYPGAVLLAGIGWGGIVGRMEGCKDVRKYMQPSSLPALLISCAGFVLVIAVSIYGIIIFLPTESTLGRRQRQWDGSAGETVYGDLPEVRKYYGYPKQEGWKAIGALRAQGLFGGDFRSVNEDFVIPIWYNYGQARSCYDTPTQFFVRTSGGTELYIPEPQIAQYQEAAWIQREGEVRLRIFSAPNLPGSVEAAEQEIAPTVYSLEALADSFDQQASPQHFIQQAQPTQTQLTQFGPAIEFQGYDLPVTTVAPGEILYLNLYWRALQPPGDTYRAFVHLTDGANLWGQQDDDPACRLPTSIWRAGQRGLGQFRLTIKSDTPPGRYPLIIGLYQAETLERLKISAGAGKVDDDFLWLGDIEVKVK